MEKQKYYIASFSGGKDSTAMVLRLLELGEPLDEVLFCDTTMEFPAMLRHVEKVRRVIEEAGIKFTALRAEHDFEHYMLRHKPKRKRSDLQDKIGYSWPGSLSRWCTRAMKVQIINKYLSELRKQYDVVQYVGIAADEIHRLGRKNNNLSGRVHPLVDWNWTEADAIAYCKERGYDWEGLYDLFGRVSCWCCPLQPLSELRTLRNHFPELWDKLRELDDQTWRTFKPGYSVRDLEARFDFEAERIDAGLPINTREFHKALKERLGKEAKSNGE